MPEPPAVAVEDARRVAAAAADLLALHPEPGCADGANQVSDLLETLADVLLRWHDCLVGATDLSLAGDVSALAAGSITLPPVRDPGSADRHGLQVCAASLRRCAARLDRVARAVPEPADRHTGEILAAVVGRLGDALAERADQLRVDTLAR
ncbi:hypothetical protein G9U51_01905 [Calidifontibacter sp. DB0510]|uniref:Uncharacterized protein n=1 Tax=Metallococcus carri TaxID=1656884 RepID=A0A967AXH8_9MICO|nr:hypothetical protein [Metallococcus carri]NHN54533.1 hypothetical protein [Metallococcus carri]NOP36628.1 hypothetical protein [Calidifontibacter sp. DB2511S]